MHAATNYHRQKPYKEPSSVKLNHQKCTWKSNSINQFFAFMSTRYITPPPMRQSHFMFSTGTLLIQWYNIIVS